MYICWFVNESVDGGYSISGAKMWISNSPIADVFVVWAKNDEGKIKGFILEKGMEGLTAPKIEGKLALRASVTGQIVMDEVFVEERYTYPSITFCYKYKYGGKDVFQNYYPYLYEKWKKEGKMTV